ncbi:hypothetical protein RUM43_006990 [Polyplax serrata]|uniref:Helicase SKI2W n=1 Tax=Polyplax serrata TaxID=468196 RepID=A0AAN8PLQ4_POLSC
MDLKVELPFGAPPILPDVQKQLQEYILCPERLPIHNYETSQQHWDVAPNPSELYHSDLSQMSTTLKTYRDLTNGELKGFKEVLMNGDPLPKQENEPEIRSIDDIINILENVGEILGNEEILTTPPWFSRGYDFGEDYIFDKSCLSKNSEDPHIINLVDLVKADQDLFKVNEILNEYTRNKEEEKAEDETNKLPLEVEDSDVINNISQEVTFSAPVIKLSEVTSLKGATSTQWAEVIDAILKLEEHCSVLVAAHTSAGKTVVAEYAIALSQRHMTRTIYTSPIKALSNQKYRDFRKTFQDVGLITGDFQINPTGTCLIMTTEILRSMLLAQNEIIRDLEYVIFDEVHYINNLNRGHVWEEVVILLPQQVRMVMLSATVPNTLQFADWVGRTKQQKMYVISTSQRPVPLEHFLYTGSGGNSKDERFLILSANNEFQKQGYLEAIEAKKKRENKLKKGAKERSQVGRKQDTTIWVALIEHLQKFDKLPMVAFVLSRKRCDACAESLASTDLTTAKEKFHVRRFFYQSIQRLKEPDRQLPQVLKMQRLLENGIGIHHSGILPILKEIVEMLFQERCVKILFATETFAMGVNMPAKTVVFDSIKKYDGSEPRMLLPSEYIQMAGRAGRRGLDKTGTVIIICKADVPTEADFINLMKGLPKKIESQFRLTYSIILKLERKRIVAEGRVTVEELMANSFKEADHLKKKKSYANTLSQVEKDLSNLEKMVEKSTTWEKMCEICLTGLDYYEKWKDLSVKILSDKVGLKSVVPGRVVFVTYKTHMNKLGIIVSCDYKKEVKFKVLVLTNGTEDSTVTQDASDDSKLMEEEWYRVISLLNADKIFVPDVLGPHTVLTIDPWGILEVTTQTVKVDPKIILGDWENRQIPRFRDNKPGQSFQRALEELTEITQNSVKLSPKIEFLNMLKDARITSEDDYNKLKDLIKLKTKITSFNTDNILDYEEQLKNVFKFTYLNKKKENLKYLLSYQSMSLYADYKNRLEVLRMLNYVDNKYSVQMKGNVACEMSNHELLITELVLRNALNDLQPAEIAALLSCFVYHGKKQNESIQVTATLDAGIETIKKVASEVFAAERECGVNQSEATGNEDELNFDLVPVVYEWAREKPFSEIMKLTDIQEGIIVRCIQQLYETIRDVKDAARIIGEPTLQQKMEDASNAIKRDIVFAASLYMQ